MLLIFPTYAKEEDDGTAIFWLGKLEIFLSDKLFKIAVSLILFSYFFTGFIQTMMTLIFIIIITYLWFYIERDYRKFAIHIANKVKSNNTSYHKEFTKSIKLTSEKKQIQLKEFIIDNIGIILILLSFMIGTSRADYVKNNIHININNNIKEYTLYLTTATGIGIYDNELEQTSFISWDNIKSMKFLKQSKEHNKTE